MIVYLAVDQVVRLHDSQLRLFGGSGGIRDRGLLESAVARPAATFGGEDLYPDIAAKAAALMHSLALNYPFIDGNKRTAASASLLFAAVNAFDCLVTTDDLVATTVKVAEGKLDVEALTIWFRQRLRANTNT